MRRVRPQPEGLQCSAGASHRQHGLTLVEVLVAVVLGSLIALAAVSSLGVARRGFSTVDATAQLRDNGRFASEAIQRLVQQSAFLDIPFAVDAITNRAGNAVPPPYVFGHNNAVITLNDTLLPSDPKKSTGLNGSDALIIQYQTAAKVPGGLDSDRSMINCAGEPPSKASTDRDDLVVSVLEVKNSTGEPSLMCSYKDQNGLWRTQPIIQGVEALQVLYGMDGVSPTNTALAQPDSVADSYLRADQIKTDDQWRRVRSLRIGMVLRSQPGAAQERGVTPKALYPLGMPTTKSGADLGSEVIPPDDGRIRQVVTFTVYLRNYAGL